MSKFKKHKAKWKDCEACELCETRENVVLFRGKIPTDVLFIGEAPGVSEDLLGKPFIGPAGKLLDKMISQVFTDGERIGFTNLIACIPLDENSNKVNPPHKEHILACGERLNEMVSICKPSLIVEVGVLASKWCKNLKQHDIPRVAIIHPAAVLRATVSQQGLAIQRAIVQMRDAWVDVEVPF